MTILEPYIPKEYLALKINYCKQQLNMIPEAVMTERKVKGSTKKVYVVKNHIYLPKSKTGTKIQLAMQQREEILCNLSKYEGLWNSAFRGLPPPDIAPRKIIRSYLNNNDEPIIMDSAFFNSLKNDADPFYPETKNISIMASTIALLTKLILQDTTLNKRFHLSMNRKSG